MLLFFVYAGECCDEQVFADGKVNHIGQVIGVIVAESQPLAQQAAKAVKITYDNLPSIITIEVGITVIVIPSVRQGMFWGEPELVHVYDFTQYSVHTRCEQEV